ncbi:MAG: O-antigen ligase family protein [Bacteroidota bacterium]
MVSHPDLTWHDQQRLGQIFLSLLAFAGCAVGWQTPRVRWSPVWLIAGAATIILGVLSSCFSILPVWALVEVALLICSIGIGAFVYSLAKLDAARADLILGGFIRILLGGVVLQFFVSYFSALMHAELYFIPWALLSGFSNVRHEGQFLSIALPLLGAELLAPEGGLRRYPRWLDFGLMIALACMVAVAGTRGTIAAWLLVSACFIPFGGRARQLAKRVSAAMAAGFALAWCMLKFATWVTNQEAMFRFSDKSALGLSAREIIWQDAFTKILENPWLGIGPMHFASLKSPIAAHPHQALLQIASEWGLPALCIVIFAVCVWMLRAFRFAIANDGKKETEIAWCILFSVSAAIIQSQVDGVLVMPYPQVWLAIVVGWGSAKFIDSRIGRSVLLPYWIPMVLFFIAVALLLAIGFHDYPALVGAPEFCPLGPRFWCHGLIE